MLIDFLSISKRGAYVFYEVAPGMTRQNNGSFVICSVANDDFEPPPAGITGTINGVGITLIANGKSLPYRLRIGNKSINQLRLWQLGCHLPHTVALDFSVSDAFKRDGEIGLQDIYDHAIAHRMGSSVAVRCSSNLEDGDTQSFAGFFDTYLDVPGQSDDIQGKIIQSYQKFCSEGNIQGEIPYDVRLGIMIQQMIQPKFSGFLFTLDPMNPPNDWVKIEYWHGPRENSEGYSITLNRETGKRVSSSRDSNQAPLPMAIQKKLHRAAVELERYFGVPQDIEFLISGVNDTLYLVQSRPITAFSYSPNKVRVDEQQKLSAVLDENRRLYHQDPVLSSTNISELFPRAIPLGYSIFKYGFAGTPELEGGISLGRSRLGYARLSPNDRAKLFYTVADQARTNIIVDALTFRLSGIHKREYLDIFVKHYLKQIRHDPAVANYPENGLYLQTDDPACWSEITGAQGKRFHAEFTVFLNKVIKEHAPREYQNAGKFFQQIEHRYHSYLARDLHTISEENLRQEIDEILSHLRTKFCPKYVVYARLAFLCAYVAKVKLSELLGPQSPLTDEQILNELLHSVTVPTELEGPQYPEFERLFKQGRIPLVEFLDRFQHLGSLDISQPRLGEYSLEKLYTVFGPDNVYEFDGELPDTDNTELDRIDIDIVKLKLDNDPTFRELYTYGGRFMRLREKAKSELLKLLWVLKRRFIEFAWRHNCGDLIYYLELDEALTLGPETRDKLRMHALQRKAYLDACQQHQVKDVLLDLQSTLFEKQQFISDQDRGHHRFAQGKTIFHGHAEGFCLTASSNEEFIDKLAIFKAKNIESIVGIFKGIELSYFNMSVLVGFTTENGGYLSHAATIAREFRLPYITDIEFNQFRDEDYVILDTEKNQVII